jgi:phage terminase large subunit-like protein
MAAFFVFSPKKSAFGSPVVFAAIVDTRKGLSVAQQFSELEREQQKKNMDKLTHSEKVALKYSWAFWARPDQTMPPVEFQTWIIMAGRGFGKTRTGAEIVREWALGPMGPNGKRDQSKAYDLVNIIAPTADDARDICVEGESGILAICPQHERPEYLPSKRRLEWPNGAKTLIFTADEPERLRGKQHKKLWCDELAAWRYLKDAWDQAQLGLRLGDNPQALVTTTPKPLKEIKELIAQPTTFLTRGTTYENRLNLAKAFYSRIISKYEGTRLGRQELNAEMLEDNPNALFQRAWIDRTRIDFETFWHLIFPKLMRTVGALDPAASSNEESDECGIIFAGSLQWDHVPPDFKKLCKFETDHYFVFEDASDIFTPDGWAQKALEKYKEYGADRLIGEANNGGDMIEATLRHHDPNVSYSKVHASKGKFTRAEPISALYEQYRVHHVGTLGHLEDQMCDYDPATCVDSPDRMDADVWALTELSESSSVLGVNDFFSKGGAEVAMSQVKKVTHDAGLAKPMIGDATERCPVETCGCIVLQNLPGGQKRCVQCGHQFGGVVTKPYMVKRGEEVLAKGRGR